MINISRAVKGKTLVDFKFYRDGKLFYETEYGEVFPVPIEDIGTATFRKTEKAMLMMRYMRAFNKELSNDD